MVKPIYIILIIILFSSIAKAQEASHIKHGLISGRLTLSPTTSLANKYDYFFLNGDIETYLNTKVSIIGEGFYFLNQLGNYDSPNFDYNHSAFFGVNWHFTKKNNDLFVGLQPGISITQLNTSNTMSINTQKGINPLISASLGYNYYLHKNFHFFVQTKIVLGQHFYDEIVNLNEFRLSAGLGFNINAKKELSK
jgi:hypothetical protein